MRSRISAQVVDAQVSTTTGIGSYRKRQVKIKERESVPRKSHCLAPCFALPGGVLKILYSIVPARLRFEGGGGCNNTHACRSPNMFRTACISHLPAESFSAFARQSRREEHSTSRRKFPTIVSRKRGKNDGKQLVFETKTPLSFSRNARIHLGGAEKKLLYLI